MNEIKPVKRYVLPSFKQGLQNIIDKVIYDSVFEDMELAAWESTRNPWALLYMVISDKCK